MMRLLLPMLSDAAMAADYAITLMMSFSPMS